MRRGKEPHPALTRDENHMPRRAPYRQRQAFSNRRGQQQLNLCRIVADECLLLVEQGREGGDSFFIWFEKLVLSCDDKAPLAGLHINDKRQQMPGIANDRSIVLHKVIELATRSSQVEQSNDG